MDLEKKNAVIGTNNIMDVVDDSNEFDEKVVRERVTNTKLRSIFVSDQTSLYLDLILRCIRKWRKTYFSPVFECI